MATTERPKAQFIVNSRYIVILADQYDNIGTLCGVTKYNGQDLTNFDTVSITQLVRNGIMRRVRAKLVDGKTRDVYMVAANCPQYAALIGQNLVSGEEIKSATFPLHETFKG